jgi:tetratricopeptide (TPR) repeat protein
MMTDNATAPGAPAAGEVVEWDISRTAKRLAGVKLAEMAVLFVGGPLVFMDGAVIFGIDEPILQAVILVFGALPLSASIIVVLKQKGALKYSAWRRYLFLLPLAVVGFALNTILGAATFRELTPDSPADVVQGAWIFAGLGAAGIVGSLWGWRSIWGLRSALLEPSQTKIADIVRAAERVQAGQASVRKLGTPVNRTRGYAYSFAAVAWLFIPIHVNGLQLITYFLIIRARQYFQISADSLLAQDKRRPILFLRSFADDERSGLFRNSETKLLDFSIESRFANLFMDFGPFIAISSPQATVPQIGAARVRLSDADWQGAVMNWMNTSNAIVVLVGTTRWVDWELSKIVETANVGKLLLFFPPTQAGWSWSTKAKRQKDQLARYQTAKAAFANSIWAAAFEKIDRPDTLIGARFHASGAITVVRSRQRNNDAYHLAAIILHQDMPALGDATGASPPALPAAHVASPLLGAAASFPTLVGPADGATHGAGDSESGQSSVDEGNAPVPVEAATSPSISPAADLPSPGEPPRPEIPADQPASRPAAAALAVADAVKQQGEQKGPPAPVLKRAFWGVAAVLCLGVVIAIVVATRPPTLGPKDAEPFIRRGDESYTKGDYDRAIQDYTQAIKLDPAGVVGYLDRGIAYFAKNDYDRAIADFTQAIKLDPANATTFYNRGTVYTNKGEDDLAIQDYVQAIKLRPDYADAFFNRAISYDSKGDSDRAIQDFTQAITLDPKNVEAFHRRGLDYFGKGDYGRAIADYSQAIALDPQHAAAFNSRCWTRFVAGQSQQGLADCNESLRLRPGDVQTLDSRGWTYFKLAQYDRAIADFTEALRLEAKLATSLYGRGLAKLKKGDRKGGNDDIAAAKVQRSDVVAMFSRWGIR